MPMWPGFISLEIEISYIKFKERGNRKEGQMRDEKDMLVHFLRDLYFCLNRIAQTLCSTPGLLFLSETGQACI